MPVVTLGMEKYRWSVPIKDPQNSGRLTKPAWINLKWFLMPIAEIIHEIDAYLLQLRQARELLSRRITKVAQKQLPRRKKKALVKRTVPTPSSKRQPAENKSRSIRSVAHRKEQKGPSEPASGVSSVVVSGPAYMEQSIKVEPERTIPQTVAITRLPASRRIRSFRSASQRTARQASRTNPEPVQPAIALAGPTNTRIVVVSADQIQRERAQAAQPAVRRPRISSSGLSGRLAFEALFEAPTDHPKGSRQ